MTKNSRQKFKYLENEKNFYCEIKSTFHQFKGFSVAKNCLSLDSVSLSNRSTIPLFFSRITHFIPELTYLQNIAELAYLKRLDKKDYAFPGKHQEINGTSVNKQNTQTHTEKDNVRKRQ